MTGKTVLKHIVIVAVILISLAVTLRLIFQVLITDFVESLWLFLDEMDLKAGFTAVAYSFIIAGVIYVYALLTVSTLSVLIKDLSMLRKKRKQLLKKVGK